MSTGIAVAKAYVQVVTASYRMQQRTSPFALLIDDSHIHRLVQAGMTISCQVIRLQRAVHSIACATVRSAQKQHYQA